MTQRGRGSLWIVELGFIALLGAPGAAKAQPMPPPGAAPAELEGPSYILLQDGSTSIVGDMRQLDLVRQLRHGNEPILWFREAGQDYVSRDPAVLGQINLAWKPVTDLAEQQRGLADQQRQLAEQQRGLADQQGQLAGQQRALAEEQGRARKDLDQQMHELSNQMHELSNQMHELSNKMNALGGKMKEASARGKLEVRAVLRRAVTSGAAKPVR